MYTGLTGLEFLNESRWNILFLKKIVNLRAEPSKSSEHNELTFFGLMFHLELGTKLLILIILVDSEL